MTKGYIYKISNNQNDKVFIGYASTAPLKQIISRDKYFIKNGIQKDKKLYEAMRELGFSNFTYEIIMEIDCTNNKDQLLKWYHIVIEHYDSINKGYNDFRGNYKGRYGKLNRNSNKPTINAEDVTQDANKVNRASRKQYQELIRSIF